MAQDFFLKHSLFYGKFLHEYTLHSFIYSFISFVKNAIFNETPNNNFYGGARRPDLGLPQIGGRSVCHLQSHGLLRWQRRDQVGKTIALTLFRDIFFTWELPLSIHWSPITTSWSCDLNPCSHRTSAEFLAFSAAWQWRAGAGCHWNHVENNDALMTDHHGI